MIKVRISPDYVYPVDGKSQVKSCSVCVFNDISFNESLELDDISDLIVLRDAISTFINEIHLDGNASGKWVKQIKQNGRTFLVTDNGRHYVEVKGGQDE